MHALLQTDGEPEPEPAAESEAEAVADRHTHAYMHRHLDTYVYVYIYIYVYGLNFKNMCIYIHAQTCRRWGCNQASLSLICRWAPTSTFTRVMEGEISTGQLPKKEPSALQLRCGNR